MGAKGYCEVEFSGNLRKTGGVVNVALKSVLFMGRIEAEAEKPRANWAVISITEWGAGLAQLREGWGAVLQQEFHDIDEKKPDEPYVLFSEAQAQEIVRFVNMAEDKGLVGVLVHCKAGISRSAAVAKWIAGRYGLFFPENYGLYNKHVLKLLARIE